MLTLTKLTTLAESMDQSKSITCTKRCVLLSLPAELRNRIYTMALLERPHIETNSLHMNDTLCRSALTRTCRQIRAETIDMFYILNVFRFDTTFT